LHAYFSSRMDIQPLGSARKNIKNNFESTHD
jgi:hypothetical protein